MQFFAFLLFVAYGVLLYWKFTLIAPILLWCGILGAVLDVLVRYFIALGANLFWGKGPPEIVSGDEPAYRNYFFHKGWLDYRSIVYTARDTIRADALRVIGWGRFMMNPFGWFLGVTLWIVSAISAIPALLIAVATGLVHTGITAFLYAAVYVSAVLCRAFEFADRKVRRISGLCPACHHELRLPVYVCKCGASHKQLIPGPYGPLYHRCTCGDELPAMLLLGRNLLTSVCRVCSHALNTAHLVTPDVFIPIVGGVSSGKSCFMTASLVSFESKESGLSFSFPVANGETASADRRNYERARARYMTGKAMDKTADKEVRAVQVCLEDASAHKRLLYLYDAAGEIFRGSHNLGNLPYYTHIHGLIFLLDPVPLVDKRVRASSSRPVHPRPASRTDSPQEVYDQVVRTLIDFSGRRGIENIPLAIVVTKSDSFNLRSQILATPTSIVPGKKPPTPAEQLSQTVRAWLVNGDAEPIVRSAELYFRNICYFESSALGRVPSPNPRPFQPHGVLEPWAWILGQCGLSVNTPPEGPRP